MLTAQRDATKEQEVILAKCTGEQRDGQLSR